MKFPPVTIVMTVYFPRQEEATLSRMLVALQTEATWLKYLVYDAPIHLHIADDGTASNDFDNFLSQGHWDRGPVTFSRQERHGIGASLNTGFNAAFQTSPFVLLAIDDWALVEPFNLTPWVKLLLERNPEVGMVRLGPPHPFLTGRVEPLSTDWDGWALRLDRVGYAFGHRPALYHRCFTDAYGPFQENVSALACEKHYAEQYAIGDGPEVVLALHHPWQHIYSIEMSSIDPNEK